MTEAGLCSSLQRIGELSGLSTLGENDRNYSKDRKDSTDKNGWNDKSHCRVLSQVIGW
jgi:hypothetical protein